MDSTSSIMDSSGLINQEAFNELFLDGLWNGIMMYFNSPKALLATLGVIALVVIYNILKIIAKRRK